MNPLYTRLVAAALSAGLVVAAPPAAWAGTRHPGSTTPTTSVAGAADAGRLDLTALRTRCLAAIDVRLPALSAARSAVTANQHVTDAHESGLTEDLDATTARLHTLAEAVKTDSDLSALRNDCRSIFEDNRVFALVLPRIRLVLGADTAAVAADRLDDVAGKLDAAIGKAEAAGRNMTQARADLAALRSDVASGRSSAATVPGAVLGLTPADWNADHGVLDPARQSLRSARSELKAARDLAVKIRNELVTPASPGV
jgi:hypothetical protein